MNRAYVPNLTPGQGRPVGWEIKHGTCQPRTPTFGIEQTHVMVIDPRPQDYVQLAAESTAAGLLFQFATTATDALKLWRTAARSIWLVNLELPDASGCDLAAAIRSRDPHSVVYLVGDQYDPVEELKARMVGGAMYVCKPADVGWLSIAELPLRSLGRCA